MRLIDADALISDCQLAQKQADKHDKEFANAFYSGGGEISTEWWCVEDMIENAPTIEPEPKKGKWIVHPEVKNIYGGTYIECSQCGEKYVVQHMEDEKYCRNCGAKMEREQKHLGNKSDLVLLDEVKYE